MTNTDSILADSGRRRLESPEHQAKCEAIKAAVLAEFEPRIEAAGLIHRLKLRREQAGEIRRRIALVSPSPAELLGPGSFL